MEAGIIVLRLDERRMAGLTAFTESVGYTVEDNPQLMDLETIQESISVFPRLRGEFGHLSMNIFKTKFLAAFWLFIVALVTGFQQRRVEAWQAIELEPIAEKSGLSLVQHREVLFSPDESNLVTFGTEFHSGFLSSLAVQKDFQRWDLATDEMYPLNSLPAFDSNGNWCALGGATVSILDLRSGQVITELPVASATLQFFPPNYFLAIEKQNETNVARVWDCRTWRELTPTTLTNTSFDSGVSQDDYAVPYLYDNGCLLVLRPTGALEYYDLLKGVKSSRPTSMAGDLQSLLTQHFAMRPLLSSSNSEFSSFSFRQDMIHAMAHRQNQFGANRFARLTYDLGSGELKEKKAVDVQGEVVGLWFERERAWAPFSSPLLVSYMDGKSDMSESRPIRDHVFGELPYSISRFGETPNRLLRDGESVLFFDGNKLETVCRLNAAKMISSSDKTSLLAVEVFQGIALVPSWKRQDALAVYRLDPTGLTQVALKESAASGTIVKSKSGNLIATFSESVGAVRVNELPNFRERLKLQFPGVVKVAISDDDRLIAICTRDSNKVDDYLVLVLDSQSGEELRRCRARGYISSVSFSPDSSRICVGVGTQHFIWNIESEQEPEVLNMHSLPVYKCDAITGEKELTIRDQRTGKSVKESGSVNGRSEWIQFNNDRRLFTIYSDGGGDLQFAEWEDDKHVSAFRAKQGMKFIRMDDEDPNIAFVFTNRLPLAGLLSNRDINGEVMYVEKYTSQEIAAFDITSRRFVKRYSTRYIDIDARIFDIDEKRELILGAEYRAGQLAPVFIADGRDGKPRASVATPFEYINDAICHPQGWFIVAGTTPAVKQIDIVRLDSGETISTLENQAVQAFGKFKDFGYLITSEHFPKSDRLNLWRLRDGKLLATFHHSDLQRVVVSPTQEKFATVSMDKIVVWSISELYEKQRQ